MEFAFSRFKFPNTFYFCLVFVYLCLLFSPFSFCYYIDYTSIYGFWKRDKYYIDWATRIPLKAEGELGAPEE
jgi:hypothetical protein